MASSTEAHGLGTDPSPDGFAVLQADAPDVPRAEIEDVVARCYGLRAEATPLGSERDQNTLLRSSDGASFVFKIGNSAETASVFSFQTAALKHLAQQAPGLPVPRLVPTTCRDPELFWRSRDGIARRSRLVTFLPGVPMAGSDRSLGQASAFGRLAAIFDRAMQGFSHPGSHHDLLWDLKQASRLRDLLPFVHPTRESEQIAAVLNRFETHVHPLMGKLPFQVIHGDLNPSNVLVDPAAPDRITGLIDFGDMVFSPRVADVAVAAAYLVDRNAGSVDPILAFVAAYHDVQPLQPAEVALLPDLIATRFALSLAISAWRAERYPVNREYILRNRIAALAGLDAFSSVSPHLLESRLRQACGLGA